MLPRRQPCHRHRRPLSANPLRLRRQRLHPWNLSRQQQSHPWNRPRSRWMFRHPHPSLRPQRPQRAPRSRRRRKWSRRRQVWQSRPNRVLGLHDGRRSLRTRRAAKVPHKRPRQLPQCCPLVRLPAWKPIDRRFIRKLHAGAASRAASYYRSTYRRMARLSVSLSRRAVDMPALTMLHSGRWSSGASCPQRAVELRCRRWRKYPYAFV